MYIIEMILLCFGLWLYIVIGFVVARIMACGDFGLRWWQFVFVILLWPLCLLLPFIFFLDWMRRGSR